MTIKLHQLDIPDTPKAVDVRSLHCIHCGNKLKTSEAFTIRADGYKQRGDYEPCTRTAQGG